ncbi:MAG: class I tRNA ligase family protein, partial [Candidatus Lokiarchaeota archaeon]|nr:class I tRNA ligase family protein [Candidatus Lokiarchaeota archaeon]
IDWCENLDWDWVISRQRVFGTPIPFWYCNDCGEIFSAKREDLPVDPAKVESPVKECTKCKSKDIIGEKDILDCWIDSSITPLVISKWKIDNDFFDKTYMKARVHRPQGYEIIRTWLFYTLFRCKKLTGKDPFDEVMINGMVAGPDGRKMSKSFGNVVSPDEVLFLYGADALRQWAAMGSLGDDYPFEYSWIEKNTKQPVSKDKMDEEKNKLPKDKFNRKYERRYNQLIGASKFLTKIWNAYRFLYLANKKTDLKEIDIEINELSAIDSYFYKEFNKVLEYITNLFEGYNWHEGFAAFRSFFWYEICDDYIEAIKYKFYLKDEAIKQNALKAVLNLMHKILKILAVISPFISEDIYSILFKNYIKQKSIHLEKWPVPYKGISEKLAEQGKFGIEIIKNVRMVKSSNKIPLNQELNKVILIFEINKVKMLEALQIDIKKTIRIKELIVIDKETQRSLTTPDIEEKIEDLGLNILIYK